MALLTFSQSYYLENNPDVLTAVLNGTFTSAEQHYILFGEKEGRMPSPYFDPVGYLSQNPDVFAAVQSGVFSTGLQHYELYGATEDRTPGSIAFDNSWYLAENPDVADAVAAGIFLSGYEHYVLYGAAEGRAPADGVLPGIDGDTFTLTTAIAETLIGTLNDDVFNGAITDNFATTTFNAGDTLTGLSGSDVFNLYLESGTPGDNFAVPPGASVEGIERINLYSNGNAVFGGPSVDASFFTGAEQIWQYGAANLGGVTNVGVGQTVGFGNTLLAGAQGQVTVANGVDSATVALSNVGDLSTVSIAETTAGDVTTVSVSGSVAAAGAATIDAGFGTTAVETLNLDISSDGALTLVLDPTTVTVDASASSGDLTFNSGPAVTVLGGSGNDTIVTGATAETVLGGSGDDAITVGLAATALTGGAGVDALNIAAAAAIVVNTAAGDSGLTLATSDKITGFTTATADLSFGSAAGTVANFIDGGLSSSYTDALTNANTAFDGTVQYYYSNDATDGYVFVDLNLDGTADQGIQLVGVGAGAVVAADIVA